MTKKIKWGILGTARIAKTEIIPAVRSLSNCEVVAVASRKCEKAEAFASKFNIPKVYCGYEELLMDKEIDAVYIPLPVSMHSEWSIKCAEADKNVLCEKPISVNTREAERMISVFAEKGLLLFEGLMYRYHPLTKKFFALIKERVIGEIQSVNAFFHVNIADENDIRFKKKTGGGALPDLGCYCVSVIRNIIGEEPDKVKSVAEWNAEGVDTSFAGLMSFSSGSTGSFECSLTSQFSAGYSVTGSEGKIWVDNGGLVPWPGKKFKIKLLRSEDYREFTIAAVNHYGLMFKDFSDALLHKRPPAFDIEDSLKNMRVIDRLYRDSRNSFKGITK